MIPYAEKVSTIIPYFFKLIFFFKFLAHEQEIVPWLDDKDVSLCPGCARPFSLLKRKHHCRLCGSVMCKNCTFLLPLENARKMVGSLEVSLSSHIQPVVAGQSVLSLDRTVDSDFRICEHCHRLLAMRETIKAHRSDRPIIAQFYERMCSALAACEKSVNEYWKIYNSLW